LHAETQYERASARLTHDFRDMPRDERRQLACTLAGVVRRDIERRENAARRVLRLRDRRRLLSAAGWGPRCWVCGYKFDDPAVRRFTGAGSEAASLPAFVDYWLPRGMRAQDLQIEVDHVVPIAAGGAEEENLRLACGWCNRHKSDRLALYDAPATAIEIRHPRLGIVSAPRPFWVVRLLALRGRCEWVGGCDRTAATSVLTVAPRFVGGSANPVNSWICCEEHDPIAGHRLVPRAVLGATELGS